MKKILLFLTSLLNSVLVSAQFYGQDVENFTIKLDKTKVIYTTDDCQFVKYSDDEEENVTTYYNDRTLQKSLKKVGLPLTFGTGSFDLHEAKQNITYTLRNDFKDDATGFEIKAGQYRGLFVDGELNLGGEVFVDGAVKNLVGFTNMKQVVLYFVPIPNECVKSVYVYGDPSNGKTYCQGRLQAMYMNADGTQQTNKAFHDTKVSSTTLYEYFPNPILKNAIYAPQLMNIEVKADASQASGYDVHNVTCDQPFKLVYNLDNKLDAPENLKDGDKASYADLKLVTDQTEATVNYYFAKKEDTSAYTDHDSANQNTPIYSATGYNLWKDKVGEKAPWSPETIIRPSIKQNFYLVGYALVSATEGAGSEYLNTNCDANGDPTMKAFSQEPIVAYGSSRISGECGENATWTLDEDGLLTISGTGAMDDYPNGVTPWKSYNDKISAVVIEDGITSVGENAFNRCSSLSRIDFPSSVENIGQYAFNECNSLTSVVLPEKLTYLDYIFDSCPKLEQVTLNQNLAKISTYAFRYCPNLERIELAEGNEHFCIVENVLYNSDCTTLVRCPLNKKDGINILPSTKVIGANAFESCKNFTSISLPESVEVLGHSAFIFCASLESINIPESIETIDVNAFYGCTSLKSLVLPSNVKKVEHQALYCSLASLTCLAFTPPTLSESACNEYGTLHVRKGCGAAYANAPYWSNFTIVEDAVENPNTVYAECVRVSTKSSEAKLPIYLNNEISMCGFEFFLQLPEGVSIACNYDEDEEGYVWGIERGGRLREKHGINVSRGQDGSYHFLCADLQSNSNFYDSEAKKGLPLLTLKLALDDNVQTGVNEVRIRDILLNHNENSTITEYIVNEEKSLMTIANSYKLSADSNNDEFGQVIVSAATYSGVYGDADAGDNVTITAVPAEHYRFVKWTENGEEISTVNPYSFILSGDKNISAVFEKNQFTVTFLDFDETVISQGLQEYDSELTAPEDPSRVGYFFLGWTPELDKVVPEHDVTYTAQYVMIGDVTGDNKRNLTDLTTLVNYIMNNVTPDSRAFLAADVNKDKKLNLTDMTSIVNLIIGGGTSMAKGTSAYYQSGNEAALSIHASELRAGSDGIMSIALNDNEDKIANLQFDLSLPHGIALSSEDLTEAVTSTVRGMSNGHNIAVKRLDSGDIRVMLFSYTNSTFCDSNDDVININVTVGNTAMDGEYEVTLKNVVLVRNNATAIEHDECNYAINVGTITGIGTLSESNNTEDSIFDVSGKKQEIVRRGVNIINGRKIVSTK